MSRIGKKPIPLPAGVKYKVEGNTVLVEGPKGKVTALIAEGISLKTVDGHLEVERASEDKAALHGLTRALVNNAVEGVTRGWKRELDIVGIGYRAELKGKGTVVFTLGYSHPIEFPLPTGIEVGYRSQADALDHHRRRPAESGPGGGRHALAAQAGPVQEQGRALLRRAAEEEGRQDGSEVIASFARRLSLARSS